MFRKLMFIATMLITLNSLWAQQKIRLYFSGPYVPNATFPTLQEIPDATGQRYEWAVPSGVTLVVRWIDYVLRQDISGKEFTFHINCATTGRRSFIAQIFIGRRLGSLRFQQFFQVDRQTYQPHPSPFTFVSDTLVTAAAGDTVSLQIISPFSPFYGAGILWGTGVDSYIEIPGPSTTAVDEFSENVSPREFILFPNYPNPFNPETTIKYQLPTTSDVSLQIYNLFGQLVTTLVDEMKPAGYYAVRWNGKDRHGNPVASGVYLYMLKTKEFTQTRKMILTR